mmetsp:Transcript_48749/g.116038  ORF Transcript_48749/g.116038 Transcript_48749/m.116038 type:complete len:209 (-) Transcript_48749:56-682(-)
MMRRVRHRLHLVRRVLELQRVAERELRQRREVERAVLLLLLGERARHGGSVRHGRCCLLLRPHKGLEKRDNLGYLCRRKHLWPPHRRGRAKERRRVRHEPQRKLGLLRHEAIQDLEGAGRRHRLMEVKSIVPITSQPFQPPELIRHRVHCGRKRSPDACRHEARGCSGCLLGVPASVLLPRGVPTLVHLPTHIASSTLWKRRSGGELC